MKLSVIIPVYNERNTLPALLEKVEAVVLSGFEKEIILVDDGSVDGTRAWLEQYAKRPGSGVTVLFHDKNCGKGAALRTGFVKATGDWVIVQDADLEYDPNDYARLLDLAVRENRLVVFGSRLLEASNKRHASFAAYVGARTLTFLTNLLYGTRLTDEATCYKLFRRDLLNDLDLRCRRFEFCPEVTAKIARRGIDIKEVPIHYYPRSRSEGKKISYPDFFSAVWTLVRERF